MSNLKFKYQNKFVILQELARLRDESGKVAADSERAKSNADELRKRAQGMRFWFEYKFTKLELILAQFSLELFT